MSSFLLPKVFLIARLAKLESSIPSAIQAPETLTDTFGTANPESAVSGSYQLVM